MLTDYEIEVKISDLISAIVDNDKDEQRTILAELKEQYIEVRNDNNGITWTRTRINMNDDNTQELAQEAPEATETSATTSQSLSPETKLEQVRKWITALLEKSQEIFVDPSNYEYTYVARSKVDPEDSLFVTTELSTQNLIDLLNLFNNKTGA